MPEKTENLKIKGYQIHLPPLGEGAFGRVYRATYRGISDRALKIFRPGAVDLSTMSRELEKLSRVAEHNGIVTLHDFDLLHDPPYYAMGLHADQKAENVWETRTLEKLCGKIDHREAWRLIRDIADALAYLHRNQIIHCDIKPSNILLTNENPYRTKICDFGQSRGLVTEAFHPAGTPLYASPEQLRDPRDSSDGRGFKWDVYSFGVVAYKLLTGKLPRLQEFSEAETNSADLESTVSEATLEATLIETGSSIDGDCLATMTEAVEEISWPEKLYVPSARKELIERCLSLDPDKRPTDMREAWRLVQDLDQQQVMRRARRLNAIFATLLVVAIWASGFAFFQAKRARDANDELRNQKEHATNLAMPFVTELLDGEITQEKIYSIIGENAEAFLHSLETDDKNTERVLRFSANESSFRGGKALENGDLLEALEKYQSAYEIRAQLAEGKENPGDLPNRISNDLMQIGKIQGLLGSLSEAESAYQNALEWRQQPVFGEKTTTLQKLRELMTNYQALAQIQMAQGEEDSAINTLDEILDIYLSRVDTTDPVDADNLAVDIMRIYRDLGEVQIAANDLDSASETYQELQKIADSLQDASPTIRDEARDSYMLALHELGNIQIEQDQLEAALFLFKEEIVLREESANARPYDANLKLAWAKAFGAASTCLPEDDPTSRSLAIFYIDEALRLISRLPPDLRKDDGTVTLVTSYNELRSQLLELDE